MGIDTRHPRADHCSRDSRRQLETLFTVLCSVEKTRQAALLNDAMGRLPFCHCRQDARVVASRDFPVVVGKRLFGRTVAWLAARARPARLAPSLTDPQPIFALTL